MLIMGYNKREDRSEWNCLRYASRELATMSHCQYCVLNCLSMRVWDSNMYDITVSFYDDG